MSRRTIRDWVRSDDCERVAGSANGHGRGDGYDVTTFRSRSTGRYLVEVYEVGSSCVSWYVAPTVDGASAVGAAGYTPGGAPGDYEYVVRPGALREVRAVKRAVKRVSP